MTTKFKSVQKRTLPKKRALGLAMLLVLGGCSSLPQDLGRADVESLVLDRGQNIADLQDQRSLLSSLLSNNLDSQSAIRIALINNPELQIEFASLGFAAAEVYEAGRIRNPIFSGSFLDPNESGAKNLNTISLVASFTDLLTLSSRSRFAKAEFEITKQTLGASVLKAAAEAESAYFSYVGAKQVSTLRAQIAKASELSLELARRYRSAGNLTPRDFAMEKAATANARLDALAAKDEAFIARKELAMILGISVGATWNVPEQLPIPLSNEDDLSSLLTLASNNRLDLQAVTAAVDLVADQLQVVGWTRILGELDLGVERERETDGSKLTGPVIDWELPIFSQNRDRIVRAEARLKIAVAELAQMINSVDNDVRLAHATTLNAKARVDEYINHLLPARIDAVARAQEEENFMLIGIFELLETKQQEYDAYQNYLEVVRDYWLSRVELGLAVGTALPSNDEISDEKIDVDDYINPDSGMPAMDHSMHGGMKMDEDKPMDHSMHEGMKMDEDKPMDHSMHEGMD